MVEGEYAYYINLCVTGGVVIISGEGADRKKLNLIVVFNYDYGCFVEKLFSSLNENAVINNDDFYLFFCDDGSKDDSLQIVNSLIEQYHVYNISVLSVRPKASGRRDYPAFGQLYALQMAIDNYGVDGINLCFLVDCDDYYPAGYFHTVSDSHQHLSRQVYFSNIIDVDPVGRVIENRLIARKVHVAMSIWPTVTCTSGVAFDRNFIKENYSKLFCFSLDYFDVWLDARVAMLSINSGDVAYLDSPVYRLIHQSNDSRNVNFNRWIKKQVQSARFFNKNVNVNKKSWRIRFLSFFDVFYS